MGAGGCVSTEKSNLLQLILNKEISPFHLCSAMLLITASTLSFLSFYSSDTPSDFTSNDYSCVPTASHNEYFEKSDVGVEEEGLFSLALPITEEKQASHGIFVQSGKELIALLKEKELWDISGKNEIPALLIEGFPGDLSQVHVQLKKKAFIHSLLPVVMVALEEVRQERLQLLAIVKQLGVGPELLVFSRSLPSWQKGLADVDTQFVLALTRKYRTQNGATLLKRVNVLPASLVLAQGAIESSWGGSRFAREANNIFGMWTWQDKGLIPARREPGKTHKIAIYDSILDSVKAYILTINRVQAYEDLRQIRATTHDPYKIAEGLLKYSEKGDQYVSIIARIIEVNQLQSYDRIKLAEG